MRIKFSILIILTSQILISCDDVSFDNFSLDKFSLDSLFPSKTKLPSELEHELNSIDSIKKSKIDLVNKANRQKVLLSNNSIVPKINYTCIAPSKTQLDSIKKIFGVNDSSRQILTTLNRKDWGFIRVGDSLVLPDTLIHDPKFYSAFPQLYPEASDIKKLILISNALQCYAAYEYGKIVRFAGVNTGTKSKPTFPGRYALNWKEKLRRSSLDTNWKLPYNWNFHMYAGNAFHQFIRPGRPASHSCVRQSMVDAKWLFDWGEGAVKDSNNKMIPLTGTPVIILDMFDYNRKSGGPWRELKSNKDFVIKLPKKPMEVEEAFIPLSQIPPELRGGKSKNDRYKFAEDSLRARGILDSNWRLSTSINYNSRRKAKAKLFARIIAKKRLERLKKSETITPNISE